MPRGDAWLIAGSSFGGPKQPVWGVNLEADPDRRTKVFELDQRR